MKYYRLLMLFFTSLLILISCEKDNLPVNISLINQSPFVVEGYIAGKWKWVYTIAGLTQWKTYYPDSSFVKFDFKKRDLLYIDHTTVTKTEPINCSKVKDGRDYVYTINGIWGVAGIFNDTLLLFMPGTIDGSSYALVRD